MGLVDLVVRVLITSLSAYLFVFLLVHLELRMFGTNKMRSIFGKKESEYQDFKWKWWLAAALFLFPSLWWLFQG